LNFRDESGRAVQLREYFGRKPVVLALVYYGCPMLCNQVEMGVVGSLKMLSFNAGRDYEVIFVSFDTRNSGYGRKEKGSGGVALRPSETASGWHFLTGKEDAVHALASAANFRYSFDERHNLFAHASGIMLLTPDGRISRYFYASSTPPAMCVSVWSTPPPEKSARPSTISCFSAFNTIRRPPAIALPFSESFAWGNSDHFTIVAES